MMEEKGLTKEERQETRFIKKETMTCSKYLRRMEELEGMPGALQPFLDTLRTVYVDLKNPLEQYHQKTVGTYCVMAPQELVYAAGAIPVKLCSGNYTAFSIGDDLYPRDACPLVKAVAGFQKMGLMPVYRDCSLMAVPVTCDCKKKIVEMLEQTHSVLPLSVPAGREDEDIDRYVEKLMLLSTHESFADGEGKRAVLRYVFRLKGYNLQNSMQDFVLLTQEIAQAIDYYIVTPNREQPTEVPQPSYTDIQAWLQWLDDYLAGAIVILDGVVLEDNTIDYDALLAQAKKELYEQLHPELIEKLLADMKEELRAEMQQQTEALTTYINDTLKTAILEQLATEVDNRANALTDALNQKFDQLGKDLSESLYEKLYFNMFDHLFNALYVPEPEEKEYIPLI